MANENPHFRFIEADVSQPWTWARDLDKPDLIAHFASPASPVDYGREPLATMAVNALGAMHGVEFARATGARFLFASTSEVYGDPLEHPQPETYWGNVNPVGERACYDESKRYAEAYVTSAVRKLGIDGRIVRIFNTYGPRMQPGDGRVIPSFCMAALRGEPLTVYGNGLQTRSFCYVTDLADGVMRLAKHPAPVPAVREYRQSAGVYDIRAGRNRLRDRRRPVACRCGRPSAGRPGAPQAGHHPCAQALGLGAKNRAPRRSSGDARIFSSRNDGLIS